MTTINNNQNEDDIKRELGGGEDDLDEDRSVGTKDEDDDDPADTTSAEASELADEGEELFKNERKRHETHDEFEQ